MQLSGWILSTFSLVECILGCSVARFRWNSISPNWKDNRKGGFKDRRLKYLRSVKIRRVNLKLIITWLFSLSIVHQRQVPVRDLLRGTKEKKEECATNNCCCGLIKPNIELSTWKHLSAPSWTIECNQYLHLSDANYSDAMSWLPILFHSWPKVEWILAKKWTLMNSDLA